MNTLLRYIEKETNDVCKKIMAYDESKRIFNYYFSLNVIKVVYSFTNSKNKQRKDATKYFVGYFNNLDSNKVKVMLSDWVTKENVKRKYKLENVVLNSFERLNNTVFNGEPVYLGEKYNLYIKKKSVIQDISDLKRVKSTIDFLRDKPSENPKDYVVVNGLVVKVTVVNITYRTNRQKTKVKECIVVSLQNSYIGGSGYNQLNSLSNIVYRYIEKFNKEKPWRALELIDVEEVTSNIIEL